MRFSDYVHSCMYNIDWGWGITNVHYFCMQVYHAPVGG